MSSDDEPTSAAEMQLLAVVETLVDDAEETQLREDLIELICWWHNIRDRVELGEGTEQARRALRDYLDDELPEAEMLVEQARRQVRDNQ